MGFYTYSGKSNRGKNCFEQGQNGQNVICDHFFAKNVVASPTFGYFNDFNRNFRISRLISIF